MIAGMRGSAYAIVSTLLTLLGLVGLLSLRFVGLYSHQALAVVVLLGCGWAVASRAWLAWKPHLHLQVQTHVDLWSPDNRSVPFAFETAGHVLARNDRVGGGS